MKEYARSEKDGRRLLVAIHCDETGCGASVRPHREIAESGWTVRGTGVSRANDAVVDEVLSELHFCPVHGGR